LIDASQQGLHSLEIYLLIPDRRPRWWKSRWRIDRPNRKAIGQRRNGGHWPSTRDNGHAWRVDHPIACRNIRYRNRTGIIIPVRLTE